MLGAVTSGFAICVLCYFSQEATHSDTAPGAFTETKVSSEPGAAPMLLVVKEPGSTACSRCAITLLWSRLIQTHRPAAQRHNPRKQAELHGKVSSTYSDTPGPSSISPRKAGEVLHAPAGPPGCTPAPATYMPTSFKKNLCDYTLHTNICSVCG